MDETYFYEPGEGHGLTHEPFKVIVSPTHARCQKA
jgi:hypothetical protein